MNKNAVEVHFENKISKPVDDIFNAIINPPGCPWKIPTRKSANGQIL